MFKKLALSVALTLGVSGAALASGFGAGLGAGINVDVNGYSANGSGYAGSATTGGSMAQGNVNGTGISAQFTSNEGAGYSAAGAVVGSEGVVTYTAGGSNAYNVSAGFTAGQAQGQTAGGVGTDYSSEAFASFENGAAGFGATIGAGFGVGFGGW